MWRYHYCLFLLTEGEKSLKIVIVRSQKQATRQNKVITTFRMAFLFLFFETEMVQLFIKVDVTATKLFFSLKT